MLKRKNKSPRRSPLRRSWSKRSAAPNFDDVVQSLKDKHDGPNSRLTAVRYIEKDGKKIPIGYTVTRYDNY